MDPKGFGQFQTDSSGTDNLQNLKIRMLSRLLLFSASSVCLAMVTCLFSTCVRWRSKVVIWSSTAETCCSVSVMRLAWHSRHQPFQSIIFDWIICLNLATLSEIDHQSSLARYNVVRVVSGWGKVFLGWIYSNPSRSTAKTQPPASYRHMTPYWLFRV